MASVMSPRGNVTVLTCSSFSQYQVGVLSLSGECNVTVSLLPREVMSVCVQCHHEVMSVCVQCHHEVMSLCVQCHHEVMSLGVQCHHEVMSVCVCNVTMR